MIAIFLCVEITDIKIFLLISIIIFFICIFSFIVLNIHPFLSKNTPLSADILVVEGWLPDYALQSALTEFNQGSYLKLITIGGLLPRGYYLSKYKTFAELSAATLSVLGLDEEKLVVIVPDLTQSQHRTYNSAVVLDKWLLNSKFKIQSLNLFTLGTHARRSWLIFKNVFEPRILVGIIAIDPLNYDPQNWCHSSEGMRTVLSELLAYLYTYLFKN